MDGWQAALGSARRYSLELLQLGIDYAFYLTDIPKHRIFNMRSLLSEPDD
jgi:hypothetical protein